jgi:hypothetical protein
VLGGESVKNLKQAIASDDTPAVRRSLRKRRERFRRQLMNALGSIGVSSIIVRHRKDTPNHVPVWYTPLGFSEVLSRELADMDDRFLRGVGETPFPAREEPQKARDFVPDPSLYWKALHIADVLNESMTTVEGTVLPNAAVDRMIGMAAYIARATKPYASETPYLAPGTDREECPFGVSDADVRALTVKTIKAQATHVAEWFQKSWDFHGGTGKEYDLVICPAGFNIMRLKARQLAQLAENLKP